MTSLFHIVHQWRRVADPFRLDEDSPENRCSAGSRCYRGDAAPLRSGMGMDHEAGAGQLPDKGQLYAERFARGGCGSC